MKTIQIARVQTEKEYQDMIVYIDAHRYLPDGKQDLGVLDVAELRLSLFYDNLTTEQIKGKIIKLAHGVHKGTVHALRCYKQKCPPHLQGFLACAIDEADLWVNGA